MIIGPISQIVTMSSLASRGHLTDNELFIIENGGIIVNQGMIQEIGHFDELRKKTDEILEIPPRSVVLPGFIDSHTHICYAGSRSCEYAKRLNGSTYQEIAAGGGGIQYTVKKTQEASQGLLEELLRIRTKQLMRLGVTSCEVKSGYGLNLKDEVKMLSSIQAVSNSQPLEMIPTCLAAHVKAKEFTSNTEYLDFLLEVVLPHIKEMKLAKRVDIFVEEGAFTVKEGKKYLTGAKELGFDILIHADQFSRGGAQLAAELHTLSADHLEVSNREDGEALARAGVIPIVLPGSSLGLGMKFPHARMLLDCGLPLVIASDWNPGSAPMGNLLIQASLLGIFERLTMAETLAAITTRAAKALRLYDRGELAPGKRADFIVFPTDNFMDVLYYQGSMNPCAVYIQGAKVYEEI